MTSDKRAHERFFYEHQALIVVPGFAPVGCQMSNVCAGGMWVSEVDSPGLPRHLQKQLSRGQAQWAEVHLFCSLEGREEHFALPAEIRRSQADGIGLRFLETQESLVSVLQRMSRQLGAKRLNVLPRNVRQAAIRHFTEEAEVGFAELCEAFLTRVFSEGAASTRKEDDAAAPFMQDLKRLVNLRPFWRDALLQGWKGALKSLFAETQADTLRQELSVVDKKQFENWLEIQQIANRLGELYRTEIYRLNQYLGQVVRRPVEDRQNPVSPTGLCQLLHDFQEKESREGGLEKVHLQQLNAAYESTLATVLGGLYERLDDRFQQLGLRAVDLQSVRHISGLPGKEHDAQPVTPSSEGVASASTAAGNRSEVGNEASLHPIGVPGEKSASVLDFMAAFQKRQESEDKADTVLGRETALQVLRTGRGRLEGLSQQGELKAEDLIRQLMSGEGRESGRLAPEVRERCQIVDQVLQLPEMCEEDMGALLMRLKAPLVEALLRDDSFLSDAGHPVRQFVNQVFRLLQSETVLSKSSRALLNESVDALAKAADQPQAVAALTQRLSEGLERQSRVFEHTAERISRKYEGQARLYKARVQIGQRLDAMFDQSKVPLILLTLLDAGLQHRLVLDALKEQSGNDTLARDLNRLRDLSVFLTGIALDTLPSEVDLDKAYERVTSQVASALADSYKPIEARAALDELKTLLDDPSLIEFVPYLSRIPEPEEGALPADLSADEGLERWLQRISELKVGDWLEWSQPDESDQRLRLVWSDDEAVRFVFLSEQGLQEKQMSLEAVARAMRDGQLRVSTQAHPEWVDQCLFQLVNDLYSKMAFQAVHDPLTGCLYRHEMEKHLHFTVLRCKSERQMAALVWLDIDQFKVINSSYGTHIGDGVLEQVGRLLGAWLQNEKSEFRLARMGGNEFALLVYPSDYTTALDRTQTLIRQFSQHPFDFEGIRLFASLSGGIMMLNGESPAPGEIINRATLACGVAKKKGGNQAHIFRETDEGQLHQKQLFDWARQIDQMVSENRLGLRIQKIVSTDGERLPKYEVLLELPKDENDTPISPQVFIEAAERFRRSVLVDRWVVHRTLEWMRQNPKKLESLSELTINLSGHSMSDDEFLHFLENEFRRGGFPASKVCFELTETAAVASLHYTADFIRSLRRFECRFALDDFGTGFSSYAYLQSFPVDYLKIDGIFIRDIDANLTNYAMVKSITELGHYLGIEIIAECIENQAAADAVDELGVQWLQGWHVEKPRPLATL